ncbi:MAG: hypothetical protein RBS96_04100 [Dehalococcoidales bacterium]|jgi:hypothetical protein|nr:hypothetical protein [Dehalococcoidales bacterium]
MSYTTRTNYEGKTAAELGLTQDLESTGAFSGTTIGIGDKYMIDLYGNMITHKVEDTPLLTILSNLGTVSEKPPYIVWNDEYEGKMWWDIAIDNLRQKDALDAGGNDSLVLPGSGSKAMVDGTQRPYALTDAAYTGGAIKLLSATSLNSNPANNILTATDSSAIANQAFVGAGTNQASGMAFCPANNRGNTTATNKLFFAIKQENDNTVGTADTVYNRLHQLLTNLGYTKVSATGSLPIALERFDYSTSVTAPVYMAFDEIHLAKATDNNTETTVTDMETHYEALILLNKFGKYTDSSGNYLFFELDLGVSNLDLGLTIGNYVAYASSSVPGKYDCACLSFPLVTGPVPATGPYGIFLNEGRTTAKHIGKMSRMVHIGRNMVAPPPIPEGDTFTAGGNFTAWRERLTNFSQIFATPKYGITGTHQASQFRFGDDFQRTRAMYLELYKGMKESAFLFGIKGEVAVTSATTNDSFMVGQPARQLGGLLDYALFPITYMKKALGTGSYTDPGIPNANFITWLDDICDRLNAFKYNGSKDLTFLVSKNFLRRLIPYTRTISNNGNIMGGQVQIAKPTQLSFGLELYTFVSASGANVKFIHEPALDTLPHFPVPYWMFGTANVSPRDIMISIDTNNIKQVVCRPDRIYGNIQDIGQDAFMEGMRGESSFILRYPKNHAIVYAPTQL